MTLCIDYNLAKFTPNGLKAKLIDVFILSVDQLTRDHTKGATCCVVCHRQLSPDCSSLLALQSVLASFQHRQVMLDFLSVNDALCLLDV